MGRKGYRYESWMSERGEVTRRKNRELEKENWLERWSLEHRRMKDMVRENIISH